ncbi:MAG: type II toxin-antitoxin system RelE/ParE family toxin [bacterium]
MIKSFGCKETQKIFNREYSLKLPSVIQRTAMRKLWMINAANSISDLKIPPANCLKKLKGERKDQHSIRVNDQWRICFKWRQQDAYEVEIIDYHL